MYIPYSRGLHLDDPVAEWERRKARAKEQIKAAYLKHKEENRKPTEPYIPSPFIIRDYVARHRAKVYGAEIAEIVDISDLYEEQHGMCGLCKESMTKEEYQIDHKTPLSRGGNHVKDNLHVVHEYCNRDKGTKTMEEYLQS